MLVTVDPRVLESPLSRWVANPATRIVARRSDTTAPSVNGMLIRVIRAACAVSITAVITNVPSRAPTTRPRTSAAAR